MNKPFFLALLAAALLTGCKKQESPLVGNPTPDTNAIADQQGTAPGPTPTPKTPEAIALPDNGNVEATLAQLTRELHRTMIGRKLSGSFEEFVAVRNLTVPPPPPGKKYAISKQWKVVLEDR